MPAKSLQSCPTLCNPKDCSPQDSSVRGILEARILECIPCPSPGDFPDPGIEPLSLTSLALAGEFLTLVPPEKPHFSPEMSHSFQGPSWNSHSMGHRTLVCSPIQNLCVSITETIISVLEWLLYFYNLKAVLFFPFLSGGRANTKKGDTAKPGIFGGGSRGSQCRTWIFLLSPFFSYSKLSLIPHFKGGFLFPHCLIHSLSKSALPPDFSPVHLLLSITCLVQASMDSSRWLDLDSLHSLWPLESILQIAATSTQFGKTVCVF